MSNLNKIMTVSICALFALTTGCNEVHIDNNGNDRKLLLFSAESEENLTQNSTKATSSALPEDYDFGVWGIARRNDGIEQDPYILWRENSLIQVNKNSSGTSEIYEPSSAAYWFSNHTYHFIAVAPFDIDATDVNVITKEENSSSGPDALEFKYSIAGKYTATANDYDFDLMGAVAMSKVDVAHPSSQDIVFKHLFSQINMNVYFKDGDRTIDGSVQKIRIRNVSTQGEYNITFDNENSLVVTCTDQAVNQEIVFTSETEDGLAFPQTLHILPQDVSKFELYLDFKIGSGAEALTMNDFKVNLSTANNTPSFYDYNQSRNWNITISPKASISFTIDVAEWVDSDVEVEGELEIY